MHTQERLLPMAGMPTNILTEGGLRIARCDFDGVENAEAIANAARFMGCWNALAGIAEPAALRSALEELRTAYFAEEATLFQVRIDSAIEKLCAMLPKENTNGQ